jgi:hypothetical protein
MLPTYRTSDGGRHDELETAITHERHLLLCKAIFEDGRAPHGSIDAIADLVARNFPAIKAVMETDLHREMLDDASRRASPQIEAQIERKMDEAAAEIDEEPLVIAKDAYGQTVKPGMVVQHKAGSTVHPSLAEQEWPAEVAHVRPLNLLRLKGSDSYYDSRHFVVSKRAAA